MSPLSPREAIAAVPAPSSDRPIPTQFFGDSIFWVEVEKIKPNPYQPRREFDDARLKDLSESIRMYGILQPLVVTRKEVYRDDGGLSVEYELISGERRLRASKLAGLREVPTLIRSGEEDPRLKLELAIIENLQREDINAVDRARAFERLANEFGMKHVQIAEKVGKSREYVSNTLRILALPVFMLDGLSEGKISDGHTRPLLMLVDHPEEQQTLFKEIIMKRMSVREAEAVARKIATDRVRKPTRAFDPELVELENRLKETLGTRVSIEQRDPATGGGKLTIDFFSSDDLRSLLERVNNGGPSVGGPNAMMDRHIARMNGNSAEKSAASAAISGATPLEVQTDTVGAQTVDDRAPAEVVAEENDQDLYSVKNFSL